MKPENLAKFSKSVIKGRHIILAAFVALTILCAVMIFYTDITYDLSAYTPSGSQTEKALTVMKHEFDDKGSCYLMVKNISEEDALTLSIELTSIEGIASVTFDPVDNYKNNNVLYTVLLSDYDSTQNAYDAIEALLSSLSEEEVYISGQAAFSYYTRLETVDSILKVGVVIIIAILAMLFFTSKTYFEVVIMIIVFGAAIIINMGTNYFFNGISYVSNLVSLVLQLALSIDYSVILLHRFMEERENHSVKESARHALSKGIVEILSSSLTTIAGLCALVLMTLPIGVEMGISLAKSIVASMLCVIFLMPALLVFFAKPLEKSKHKSFVPSVKKPAKAIVKARYIIISVFIALVALAGVAQFNNNYSFNMNSGHRIISSNEKILEEFGYINDLVIMVPKGDYALERQLIDYVLEKEVINKAIGLSTIELADGVILTDSVTPIELAAFGSSFGLNQSFANVLFLLYIAQNDPQNEMPVAEYKAPIIDLLIFAYDKLDILGMEDQRDELGQLVFARNNFESDNYSRIMFNINSYTESEESFALIKALQHELGQFYNEFYILGESVMCYDMATAFPRDNLVVSVFTVFFVMIILLITFKNLIFPIILILVIQGGIWINFAIPFVAGTPVSFIAYLLICAIQMGATIDYAIVLTSRYRATKIAHPNKFEAMAIAQDAVFATIITSGTILTITGFAMGILASGMVASMGMLLGMGALISVLAVLFVLPSMLLVLDKITEKASFSNIIKRIRKKKD